MAVGERELPRGNWTLGWRKAAALGAAASALLFVSGAVAASLWPYLPGDVGLAQWLQALPFGPLAAPMKLTNAIGGNRHTLLTIAIAVPLAIWRWRAGLLVALGIPAILVENFVKDLTQRPRPSDALLQIREVDTGFSYPSGHATSYTWLALLLVVALWPWLPARARPFAVAAAALVIVIACTGRVWAGVHWPSDVLGGFLLGLAWSWLAWRVWSFATRRVAPGDRSGSA
jgi:membrane-associated phospholipid phosphatase